MSLNKGSQSADGTNYKEQDGKEETTYENDNSSSSKGSQSDDEKEIEQEESGQDVQTNEEEGNSWSTSSPNSNENEIQYGEQEDQGGHTNSSVNENAAANHNSGNDSESGQYANDGSYSWGESSNTMHVDDFATQSTSGSTAQSLDGQKKGGWVMFSLGTAFLLTCLVAFALKKVSIWHTSAAKMISKDRDYVDMVLRHLRVIV